MIIGSSYNKTTAAIKMVIEAKFSKNVIVNGT